MIVDSHAHIFSPEVVAGPETYRARDEWFALLNPGPRPRLATADDLMAEMARSGVDVSVAVGFGWRDQALCVEQNDALIAAGRSSGGKIVPFCTVQPRAGAAAAREVERCAAAGCRGVGELYPDGQGFAVDDLANIGPLLEVCRALRLPILIHASEPVGHSYRGKGGTTPDRLYGLLRLAAGDDTSAAGLGTPTGVSGASGVPLILAHCGGGFAFYELMPEIAALTEQVYYDTAAAAYLYRPAAVARLHDLAPGRVLFGSDYRLLSQRRMLRYVRDAGLPPQAAAAVLGGNAARLLGLPPA